MITNYIRFSIMSFSINEDSIKKINFESFTKLLGLVVMAFLLVASIVSSAQATSYRPFIPSLKVCLVPTPIQTTWLPTEWQEFLPFVRVCHIIDKRDKPVLLIVSVWAELYYSDKSSGAVDVSMPKPLLFFPGGKLVGIFPTNFPDDPPNELILTFKSWLHGFPQRIDLLVKSPTASGDQVLPSLVWSKAAGKYLRQP